MIAHHPKWGVGLSARELVERGWTEHMMSRAETSICLASESGYRRIGDSKTWVINLPELSIKQQNFIPLPDYVVEFTTMAIGEKHVNGSLPYLGIDAKCMVSTRLKHAYTFDPKSLF